MTQSRSRFFVAKFRIAGAVGFPKDEPKDTFKKNAPLYAFFMMMYIFTGWGAVQVADAPDLHINAAALIECCLDRVSHADLIVKEGSDVPYGLEAIEAKFKHPIRKEFKSVMGALQPEKPPKRAKKQKTKA